MKRIIFTAIMFSFVSAVFAQKTKGIITAAEAERIERVLASDEMKGRKTFSPEIDKAADFIADEFKKAGLSEWKQGEGYKQSFALSSAKQTSLKATVDGQEVDAKNVLAITFKPELKVTEADKYETAQIAAGQQLFQLAYEYINSKKNLIVVVDTSFARNLSRLSRFKSGAFASETSVIFILGTTVPKTYSIEATHEITESKLANVVGVLPGKVKKMRS
ncbi:MAG: hypothetical protein NVV59_09360 [Chitinophagaceae bacterium]|nr:hypothetical protein [Chitinophagaceae bacterium]